MKMKEMQAMEDAPQKAIEMSQPNKKVPFRVSGDLSDQKQSAKGIAEAIMQKRETQRLAEGGMVDEDSRPHEYDSPESDMHSDDLKELYGTDEAIDQGDGEDLQSITARIRKLYTKRSME